MPEASFDWYLSTYADAESGNQITIHGQLVISGAAGPKRGGVWVWLSDSVRGALTATAPSTWAWNTPASACVLNTATTRKHYLCRTNASGKLSCTLGYNGAKTWFFNTAACDGGIRSISVTFS